MISIGNQKLGLAQINPDDTLGAETSVLDTGTVNGNSVQLIEGGATRGGNLFHSFSDFNVGLGESVYFAQPINIDNILSRVTGNSLSTIDGVLGVAGTANLFLLNPNGIIFGPAAQLDIAGSFTASTAGSFAFSDGNKFSAIAPETSLLSVSVPLGIQFNTASNAQANAPASTQPIGNIASRGTLEAGNALTLSGNQLSLEGALIAGNDLTLQAQDTVTIRDTQATAFLAQSGNDLTIQGNQGIDILTLQHLSQTPFVSGGDISLISDGVISADAHFESGGSLQLLTLAGAPGNFVSFYDPIILANGDVVFGDYTGAALKVETTGSIQAGDIFITGPDTALTADGTGSDEDLLASSRAAILRAGVASGTGVNVPQVAEGTNFRLATVANQPPGSIVVNSIRTLITDGSAAGPIILDAQGNIEVTGLNGTFFGRPIALSALSLGLIGDSQAGGDIKISTNSGDINIQNGLFSNSIAIAPSGYSGTGGNISISSQSGDINIGGSINSSSRSDYRNSGSGGDISISTGGEGDISLGSFAGSYSRSLGGNSGEGGNISVSARGEGSITLGGGLYADSLTNTGNTGSGGNIFVSSNSGSITAGRNISAYSSAVEGNTASGGSITISSTSGDIMLGPVVNASSQTRSGSAGAAGSISIESSDGGSITAQILDTLSSSAGIGSAAAGGSITVSSTSGDILLEQKVTSSSQARIGDYSPGMTLIGDSGDSGNITISSGEGNITIQQELNAGSRSGESSAVIGSDRNMGNAGRGGNVTITSTSGDITTLQQIFAGSISASRGNSSAAGDISITSKHAGRIRAEGIISATSLTDFGETGDGGTITISSEEGNITTNEVVTSATFAPYGNAGNAGDITISSLGRIREISDSSMSADMSTREIRNADSLSFSDENSYRDEDERIGTTGAITIGGEIHAFSLSFGGSVDSGGDISVTTRNNVIRGNSSQLLSFSIVEFGDITSDGGTINLAANAISDLELVTFSNGGSSGNVRIQGSGNNLIIEDLDVTSSGQFVIPLSFLNPVRTITISLANARASGNTTITNDTGNITLNNVTVQSDANSNNPAGNITIASPGQVTFANTQINSNTNSAGAAGNILIEAARLSLGEGDRLLAATSGSGTGGTITINTTDSVFLGEGVQNAAPIISVEASGAGRPGNIVINTPNFVLSETASITATSTATATNQNEGGSITLSANQMDLAGTVGIFAETQGQAPGGVLTLQPYQANLNPSQSIAADASLRSGSSFGLTLAENSLISASTTGSGNGGGLRLFALDAITISGPGRLAVETSGTGRAGNATASARSLTLADGVVLSASTSGPGIAGDITFNIAEALTIDGSTVESRTTPGSTGGGGNINVFNAGQTNLINGGSFSLNSEGQGAGGDFNLTGGSLTLDGSNITAVTRNSNGGNFTFNLSDYLLLRNGSLISTEAGTAGAGGNGGRIAINTPNGFVIALPNENSDIRANAFEGDGGNVNITARNLLGIAFRPGLSDTPGSDITSSSEFGNSGTVTIDELNPNNLEPEVDLPVETAPATVARGCRGQGAQTGSFVSTGRGGLPSSPIDPVSANSIWQDIAPLEVLEEGAVTSGSNLDSSYKDTVFDLNEPITEAQGWQLAADGTVTLLAERAELGIHRIQANMCGS